MDTSPEVALFLVRCPHLQASLVRERRLATEGWMHQGKRLTRRYRRYHLPGPSFRFTLTVKKYFCYYTPLPLPPSQTTSSALKGAIQLGIGYTVGNLSSKPERDVLMQDFYVVESIFFPRFTQRTHNILDFVAGVDHHID